MNDHETDRVPRFPDGERVTPLNRDNGSGFVVLFVAGIFVLAAIGLAIALVMAS